MNDTVKPINEAKTDVLKLTIAELAIRVARKIDVDTKSHTNSALILLNQALIISDISTRKARQLLSHARRISGIRD